MKIHFTKMQGLGNDFVIIDAVNQQVVLTKQTVKQIADRNFGVGCDQVLLVEPASNNQADFFYRIYNADGSEVAQCGNGARCVAKFIQQQKLSDKKELMLETLNRLITIQNDGDYVSVAMGLPQVEFPSAPLIIGAETYVYTFVDIGNPHAVIIVNDIEKAEVDKLGYAINELSAFPEGVNIEFVKVNSPSHIAIRVYERGVGETLACGSGAVAAAVAGIMRQLLQPQVSVSQKGGELTVLWQDEKMPIWMTGPAEFVFKGVIDL